MCMLEHPISKLCVGAILVLKKRCSHEFNMVFDLMNFNDFYVFFGL